MYCPCPMLYNKQMCIYDPMQPLLPPPYPPLSPQLFKKIILNLKNITFNNFSMKTKIFYSDLRKARIEGETRTSAPPPLNRFL